jgi:methylmalonyl-CoA mutase
MPLDSYDSIFNQFPAVSAQEWKHRIIRDLKGNPFEKLEWHNEVDVLPFYTKENNKKYQLSIPEKMAGWKIVERITVRDVSNANALALQALKMGVEIILFNVDKKVLSKDEAVLLVKDIILDAATVYFENFIESNRSELESVVQDSCPYTLSIPKGNSIIDELTHALKHGIKQFRGKQALFFHFYTGTNYFFEIAKLRAFRWLWKQVCDHKQQPYALYILSETNLIESSANDEYANMLSNTTEAMSAVLGGCDALIINSHDAGQEDSGFGRRIARNVHHILRHESYFTDITDAAKGSYYIEYLTYEFARKAWGNLSVP